MKSFQNISIIFILLISTLSTAQAAGIDYKTLKGEFDFISCEFTNSAIWSAGKEDFFVGVYEDLSKPMENNLYLMRMRKEYHPFALGWHLFKIDQGTYEWAHPDTGKVEIIQHNYTDELGLWGDSTWDYILQSGSRVFGKNSIHLSFNSEGNLEYEMMVQHGDGEVSTEKCILKRKNFNDSPF